MLTPNRQTLHTLMDNYVTARARHQSANSPMSARALDDAAYTLCVSTGTRTIHAALRATKKLLRTTAADPLTSRTLA